MTIDTDRHHIFNVYINDATLDIVSVISDEIQDTTENVLSDIIQQSIIFMKEKGICDDKGHLDPVKLELLNCIEQSQ